MSDAHYRSLEKMYHDHAPINQFYNPILKVSKGLAELSIPVKEEFFHAAGSLHGSVYFKAADDAAYFAAQSLIKSNFLYTTNFNLQIIRPVSSGNVIAIGKVIQSSRAVVVAEAELFNDKKKLIAKGQGNFLQSGQPLTSDIGYRVVDNSSE